MRKIVLALMLLLVCTCAYADVMVYRGTRSIGAIASKNNYVPIDDFARLLGFTVKSSGQEVLLSRGRVSFRVIPDSAVIWRGASIIPLQEKSLYQDGHIWLDSQSALNIFQAVISERLRLGNIASRTARASEADLGIFSEPTPEPEPAQPVVVAREPEPEQPVTTASTPKPKPAPAKSQPKHQTYKPEDDQTGTSISGTIQAIRWTDTGKRIRAVIVADDDADPEVYMQKGKLHALFSSSLESNKDLASPYEKVIVELIEGSELIFTAPEMLKAEKTVSDNPRRIVFDFFFPEPAQAVKPTEPEPEPTQPVTPEPEPKRAAPLIIVNTTPRTESPAVKTLPSSITMQTVSTQTRKTIVIDAGHGGKDPGTSGNGAVEKDINLSIAQELSRILTGQGYNVIMTRNSDIYLTLQERTDIANNANADVFVSIHVNALPRNTSTTGIEIYIMALPTDNDAMNLAKAENREYVEDKGVDIENVDRRTEMLLRILGDMQQNNKISESTEFASVLYNAGAVNGLPMRRVAQAPFFVLRGAGMPAVLIETGFITNASEARNLVSPEYQASIANAIARGIMSYKEMR